MNTPRRSLWRMWYEFRHRNWWQVDLLKDSLLIAAIMAVVYLVLRLQKYGIPLLALLVLVGCGSERQEQQNTVEQEVWEAGPVDVETWAGNMRIHKTVVVRRLSRYRTTTEQKEYTFPEAREVGSAMLGGLAGPLAGGGVIGLLATLFMRRQSMRNAEEKAEMEADRQRLTRQRDEVIDGIERAKPALTEVSDAQMKPAWDRLKAALEAEQSRDTKAAVKARVG